MRISNIQQALFALVLSVGLLSACQKPADTATADPAPTQQTTETQAAAPATPDTTAMQAEGEHAHEGHDHAHDHAHDDSKPYACDNNQTVRISVHQHDGDMVAHAIIDDIVYDMPQEPNKPNHYVSLEGIGNQGLLLVLEGDKATFKTSDGKTTHFICQAQA